MLNLSNSDIIKIIVNLAIFVVLTLSSILLVSKLKLQEKGYKYLFLLYTIFWVPIMLVRPYRGTMQTAIDKEFLAIVLSVYGFIGIFIRLFADVINYLFKYRKAFLYFCVVSQTILFIPIIIQPNTTANILEAIGIGIGASCIGTYELLFKEQYGNKKAFLTVSVLSIPPLLANFLTAPIQSVFKTLSTNVQNVVDPWMLRYLWVISLGFLVICFVMVYFLKEKRMEYNLQNYYKDIRNPEKAFYDVSLFVWLSIIGSVVAFIKFSNSDSVATLHLQNLGKLTNNKVDAYEGYISVIFSLFQLIAGVLMGMYLIKKMNVIWVFLIGVSSWVVYTLSSSFISNPIGYFAIHSLNGFGYGILYNLILAMVLKTTIDNKIITKMGIYQSVLSIGITASGYFTTWIKNNVIMNVKPENITINEYMYSYFIHNMVLIGVIGVMTIAFTTSIMLFNKRMDNSFNLKRKVENKKIEV